MSSPGVFGHLLPSPFSCKLGIKSKSDRVEVILYKPVKVRGLLGFNRQKPQVRGSTACLPHEDAINFSVTTCKSRVGRV